MSDEHHSASIEVDRQALLTAARALVSLGLADLRCRVSVREGDRIVTMPRPGGDVRPPGQLAADHLLTVDLEGRLLEGRGPVPLDIVLDAELYRRDPRVRAVVHAQPRTALAFGAARRDLLPLTHTEAILADPSLPMLGDGHLVATPDAAADVVEKLGDARAAILVGQGTVAAGRSLAEAAMLTQQVELLARINALAAGFAGAGPIEQVARADSQRITSQKAPPDDFERYFEEIDRARPNPTAVPDPGDDSEDGLRRRLVVAALLLYEHGLVEHLEHLTICLPGRAAFLMTPRKHLGRLMPDEIATVDMDGQWIGGLEPPPFRWFHRDILAARPDVAAIVHTHQPYARALALTRVQSGPLHRGGAQLMCERAPVYPVPDLMFDEAHRQAAVALLGDAAILHERAHGVDFLAPTIEEATVAALLYEDQVRLLHLANQLGSATFLGDDVVEEVAAADPSPLAWWRHFLAELPG